jgi:hypothetical protein
MLGAVQIAVMGQPLSDREMCQGIPSAAYKSFGFPVTVGLCTVYQNLYSITPSLVASKAFNDP